MNEKISYAFCVKYFSVRLLIFNLLCRKGTFGNIVYIHKLSLISKTTEIIYGISIYIIYIKYFDSNATLIQLNTILPNPEKIREQLKFCGPKNPKVFF